MKSQLPILVTGSSRSGTTWVGRCLAYDPAVRNIYEPFNSDAAQQHVSLDLPYKFLHITGANEAKYRLPVSRLLTQQSWQERLAGLAGRRVRPLVKDPLALFTAPWLAERFKALPVVLIRHPAGVVSSRRRLGWNFDFGQLLEQPLLCRGLLNPWVEEMRMRAAGEADPLADAILLWKVIYHVVAEYRRNHPDWLFVRHEDLCADPIGGFQRIYAHLGLRWTERIREQIESGSSEENAAETASPQQHVLKRDSRLVAQVWRQRLAPEEISRIRAGTAPVAEEFYSDSDW